MNRYLLLFIMTLFVTLNLVACGPDETEIAATIEQQVAFAAAATLTSIPPVTPLATLTSQPTYTSEPPASPLPSLEPQATYTVRPTLTPQPTYTLPPTLTPSITPAQVAPLPTLVANPTEATNFAFDAIYVDIVRNRMDRVITLMFPRTAPIDPNNPYAPRDVNRNVDCANTIIAYEFLLDGLISQPANLTVREQEAYTNYQNAITLFTTTIDGFVQTCHTYLVNQQEGWRLSDQEMGVILTAVTEVKASLQTAIYILNSE